MRAHVMVTVSLGSNEVVRRLCARTGVVSGLVWPGVCVACGGATRTRESAVHVPAGLISACCHTAHTTARRVGRRVMYIDFPSQRD